LLLHEHYKGLQEVWYCHKLFWSLSALGSLLVIKFSTSDIIALVLDISIAFASCSLVFVSLKKERNPWGENNRTHSTTQLIHNPSLRGTNADFTTTLLNPVSRQSEMSDLTQ